MSLLEVQLFCPISGFKSKNGTVTPAHKMTVRPCVNGTLLAYCQTHITRCFIASQEITKDIAEASDALKSQPKEGP
jgi:hypothetical protein